MNNLKELKVIFSLLLITFLFSCNDSESNSVDKNAPTISVRLVDAPGDYEAVNIEVVDVKIKMNDDGQGEDGWMSLETDSGIVNLLDFTGGISKVLVDRFPIPAGTLSQMRLVLGNGNTIVIKNDSDVDETFDLKTPSGQQSGLKLKVDAVIEEGFTYDFVIDFDVKKSIVIAGNSGNIILKPVLYVSSVVSSGIIEGTVTPIDVPSIASVLVDDKGNDDAADDFVISAFTDETGAFALWGVPAGTYEVVITPINVDSDYSSGSATGVVVTNGDITIIVTPIEIMLKPGSISGTVSGMAADIVASASIIVNGNPVTVETDTDDMYKIENIPPGDYAISISATGYVSQDVNVTVSPNQNIIADVTLVLAP